ncbi:hypothetical protein L4174_014645 [Photobacterium sp. CCB-ST2H9]|uniref:hypothetical protein n=1 Tax=Photobacterium sp. CCB-ST2H9 TaxID=2912855 RepID=UPI00200307C9|nr:hypothetical protein [Photobacterium sp. CCB-ST2H9]UTM57019.1 hypothetical protein L4174_014645 [Photobacterium sp. CCB-ST2H9]
MESNELIWTPKLIIDLIDKVIWPATIIFLGVRFRASISNTLKSFFSKNTLTEFSASLSGVAAKFAADKQSVESSEKVSLLPSELPEGMTLESVKAKQSNDTTEYSEFLLGSMREHLSALNLSDNDAIELLLKEASILRSTIHFGEISRVLFRSQFDILESIANQNGHISKINFQRYFEKQKNSLPEAFSGWDWIKYAAFPVSSGLITDDGDNYRITIYGSSYIKFLSKYPQLIENLPKL